MLEIGELFIAFLAAVRAVVLVNHFFVAVLAWAALIKAILLTQIHHGSYAREVVCLKREKRKKPTSAKCLQLLSRSDWKYLLKKRELFGANKLSLVHTINTD